MVERCALSGSDLKIKCRTILLISMRKCCQSPRHLVEILLLIVLVDHVDLFEQSSIAHRKGT